MSGLPTSIQRSGPPRSPRSQSAILQAPGKNQVQACSGSYSELPELGNCPGEPPTRNAGTHSTAEMEGPTRKRWYELCELAAKEQDANNLIDLVKK